jgi:pimeloyl-ACP methyl ester carboxylesterase
MEAIMNRKPCVLFIVLCLFGMHLYGVDPDYAISKYDKSSEIGTTAFFLDGFRFYDYNKTYPTLTQMTTAEVNAVRYGTKVSKPSGKYTVIGYSQGGLRALAYATKLKQTVANSEFKKLEAVITISGIDQGIQALSGDLSGIRSRVLEEVDTIEKGFYACAAESVFGQLASAMIYGIYKIINLSTGVSFNDAAMDLVANKALSSASGFSGYLKPALLSENKNKSATQVGLQQLDDMKPGSGYQKNFVADTLVKSYRVKDGSVWAAEWRKGWLGIPYLWIGKKDTYKTVYVSQPLVKFDPNIPVGFIVGTRNSFDIPAGVRNQFNYLGDKFEEARVVHTVKSWLVYGLILGCPAYARNAENASNLVWDVDGMINKVTGSYDGDGLVARANQYYPGSFYNPQENKSTKLLNNVLKVGNSDYGEVKANHIDTKDHATTINHLRTMVAKAKTISW